MTFAATLSVQYLIAATGPSGGVVWLLTACPVPSHCFVSFVEVSSCSRSYLSNVQVAPRMISMLPIMSCEMDQTINLRPFSNDLAGQDQSNSRGGWLCIYIYLTFEHDNRPTSYGCGCGLVNKGTKKPATGVNNPDTESQRAY